MNIGKTIPPAFKKGQLVCFRLLEKKGPWTCWYVGKVASNPIRKDNEDWVDVRPCVIPESFHSRQLEEEWACLDPLHIEFSREAFILNWLDTKARVPLRESLSTIPMPVKELCPATTHHFRMALAQDETLSRKSG